MNDYQISPELYQKNLDYYRAEISKCTYRQFTTGFYFGKTTADSQIYDNNTYIREYTYLGMVERTDEQGRLVLEQRNKFTVGETVEAMLFDGENQELIVQGIWDDAGNTMESAPHPKQRLHVDFGMQLPIGCILRRKED